MIPYGRQDITQADIDAVVAVLQSDFLTKGPMVPTSLKRLWTFTAVPCTRWLSVAPPRHCTSPAWF